MENRNLKQYIKSNTITKEKIKNNISQSKNKIIDLKLPHLHDILKRHFRKKKKKESKRKSYHFPHSARELKTELIKLKNKTLSETSLGNINKTLEYSGYNTSNEKSLINNKIENKNYSLYPFNKRLIKTRINQSNDSSFFNNNLSHHKPKKTIINIYNTSVKTSPKIFLLSSYINSSTSCHNTTPSNKKSPKNNILNLKLNSKKNFPISLNSNYININSFSGKNNMKYHNRNLETFSNFPIKKKYIIDINDKELSSIINDKILKKNYIHYKSFDLKHTINDIENQSLLNIKIEDINETLRNKYINKFSMKNDKTLKQIEFQKDLIINSCNKIRKKIDLIFQKKKLKPKSPCLKEIINNYYKGLFKERKYFKKVENYLIKKIKYQDLKKINIIPKSINEYLLYDLEQITYEMATSFVLGGNIIERHYIKKNELKKTSTMKSVRHFKISHVNLYFCLEKFIKNDIIIHENNLKLENYIKKVETTKSRIKKKKVKKLIKPSSKNSSILNNRRISTKLFTRKLFLNDRENDLIKITRRNSYIKKLKFGPSTKVSNIKFHLNDQELVMTKAKDMSKEHLIFRTEEIKLGLKKKLRTIEEILFFLIRENNFREFKEIQERYHVSLESLNKNKDTFLIYATQCGYENFVQFLIDKGANLNAQNEQLNTALHYALNFKKYNISDLLLKAGASEIIFNKYNLTPWEFN